MYLTNLEGMFKQGNTEKRDNSPVFKLHRNFYGQTTIPTVPPTKLCCMLYAGNSVRFNTKHLATISTDARTARPAKGATSLSQQLGNSCFLCNHCQTLPAPPGDDPSEGCCLIRAGRVGSSLVLLPQLWFKGCGMA